MSEGSTPARRRQVERHFDRTAGIWQRLYREETTLGRIFRERQSRAVAWVVERSGGSGRVLDVGCGAGGVSVELARLGFSVDAIDSSDAMLRNARAAAEEAGVAGAVSFSRGDVHALGYEDGTFDVVVALGVLPWVASPAAATHEMGRVLRAGGHLIATCDNALALQLLLDPRLLPVLDPLKRAVRTRLRPRWQRPERPRALRPGTIRRLVLQSELELVEHLTIQFGPFSFLGLRLMPDRLASRLHDFLQRRADAGAPVLRSGGRQHMLLARRRPDQASAPTEAGASARSAART